MAAGSGPKCDGCRHLVSLHTGTFCAGGTGGCECAAHGPPPAPVREVDAGAVERLVIVTRRALDRVDTLELYLTDPRGGAAPRGPAREAHALLLSLLHALGRLRDGQNVPDQVHDELLGVPWETMRAAINERARSGVTYVA